MNLKLLATRRDIFPHYNESGFEEAFEKYFKLEEKVSIPGSERSLYLFEKSITIL